MLGSMKSDRRSIVSIVPSMAVSSVSSGADPDGAAILHPKAHALAPRVSLPRVTPGQGKSSPSDHSQRAMTDAAPVPADGENSDATLLALPPECQILCLSCLSLVDLASAAAACSDLRNAARDPALWQSLLRSMWHVPPPLPEGDAALRLFIDRLVQYRRVCAQRFDVSDGPWLQEVGEGVPDLEYIGNIDDATHDHSVGCAVAKPMPRLPKPRPPDTPAHGALHAWPVGDGASVIYYEVTIAAAGERGFIAVGWAREEYPSKCRQPGWDAHTYGYHGDDGRFYHHSGYGRRFNGPFTTGQTVGTGLVFRPRQSGGGSGGSAGDELGGAPSGSRSSGVVFYTVDGMLVGSPFDRVAKPHMLHPAVGLHSPHERVTPVLGGTPAELLAHAPPLPPTPFMFDLNAAIASRSLPGLDTNPVAGGAAADITDAAASNDAPVVSPNTATSSDGESTDSDIGPTLQAELEELAALVVSNEETPEVLSELRFFARSRLGFQADHLHASWGAPNVDELQPDRLRHLCWLLVQAEGGP